jgi:hypothetical protein
VPKDLFSYKNHLVSSELLYSENSKEYSQKFSETVQQKKLKTDLTNSYGGQGFYEAQGVHLLLPFLLKKQFFTDFFRNSVPAENPYALCIIYSTSGICCMIFCTKQD